MKLTGVLLEVDKTYDFGNGTVSFSRQALQRMAEAWNKKQEEQGLGIIESVLTMDGDKLLIETKVHMIDTAWFIPELDMGPTFGKHPIKERG